jgi:hypothetical protein
MEESQEGTRPDNRLFHGRRGSVAGRCSVVRGLAFAILAALAAVPATSAELPSVPAFIEAPFVDLPAADAGAHSAADLDSQAAAANLQGVCVRSSTPGTTSTREAQMPVVVDDADEGDRTGVELGGGTQDGLGASACVIPCMPVSPLPPEIHQGCIDDWTWYLCGRTCLTMVTMVEEAICGGCLETRTG